MIQTISVYDFVAAFRGLDRADQFSREGLHALFDYLEEINPDFDLDVIALCCAYSEDDQDDARFNYSIEGDVLDWLQDRTIVVGVTQAGSVVYCSEF